MSQEKKSNMGLVVVLVVLGFIACMALFKYMIMIQRTRNFEQESQFSQEMYYRQLEAVEQGCDRGDYSLKEARDRINKLSDDNKREMERRLDRYRDR
jgi:flagellar biosynthesis/type III secretory pathway M-ring protein FliF/YscJ